MLALKSAEKDQEKYQHALSQLERIQQEKLFLTERLSAAELELSLLKKSSSDSSFLEKERDRLASQLNKAEEKIGFLSKLEPLHRQLRLQFEEKNKVLQETRAALFHVDTELQTLKIEREQQAHILPEKITQEFVQLDEQVISLEKENQQLQALVSHFITQLPQGQKKTSLTKTLDEALFAAKQRRRGEVKKKVHTYSDSSAPKRD